ncbi:MAG: endonuclease III [Ruminococcaceae bacterium]|nr:endonuclease III [Oscillospiraceae bacterium]
MTQLERAREFCARLEKIYPEAQCALESGGEAWKLLIMGRLSAQCTDARVNIVCRELFERMPTLEAVADCDLHELEEIVRPCGLYKTKAKNIKDACIIVRDRHGGVLPDTMEELLELPGVGRKIANLLLGDVYGKPAIVTDTHCIRICGRIGLYPESLKDPVKIEKILIPLIEPEKQSDFCHRVVQYGRDVCTARSPKCGECPMRDICLHEE